MMGPAPFARLVLLQMRSDRTAAPFMPVPPDHDSNSHYCRQNQHQQQGRIFNPCNRRNAKRHDQAKQANLPGKNVHAGGEGAERKQREDREAVEVAFKTLCTLAKNTMFITSRNAIQCSNCVAISRSRLELSTLGHPYQTQTRPKIGAKFPSRLRLDVLKNLYKQRRLSSVLIRG